MTRARLGQAVRISDYFSAMRTCINRDRGDVSRYKIVGDVGYATLEEREAA